jgi:hypothetical protein
MELVAALQTTTLHPGEFHPASAPHTRHSRAAGGRWHAACASPTAQTPSICKLSESSLCSKRTRAPRSPSSLPVATLNLTFQRVNVNMRAGPLLSDGDGCFCAKRYLAMRCSDLMQTNAIAEFIKRLCSRGTNEQPIVINSSQH